MLELIGQTLSPDFQIIALQMLLFLTLMLIEFGSLYQDMLLTHKVYESANGGLNWVNITANGLPNLPVNCIVYQAGTNDDLYVGTDVGVYYKNNTMTDWIPYMTGLPNVVVKELEIHYASGTISAATYGRGVWESPVNTISVDIYEISAEQFKIYPNPAQNKITISMNNYVGNDLTARIYSITGQLILESQLTNSNHTISTAKFSKGCYIVEISNKNGFSTREKLIIK